MTMNQSRRAFDFSFSLFGTLVSQIKLIDQRKKLTTTYNKNNNHVSLCYYRLDGSCRSLCLHSCSWTRVGRSLLDAECVSSSFVRGRRATVLLGCLFSSRALYLFLLGTYKKMNACENCDKKKVMIIVLRSCFSPISCFSLVMINRRPRIRRK